jgi:hypothetical protein
LTPENLKRERAREVMTEFLTLLPPSIRAIFPLFMNQFQSHIDNLTEEDIDEFLAAARAKLDYIEKGE